MNLSATIKKFLPAAIFLLVFTFACDAPNRDELDEDAGTSEAIVGDSSNLAEPRPAPIGDTAETEEQQDQFGELPPNTQPPTRGEVD